MSRKPSDAKDLPRNNQRGREPQARPREIDPEASRGPEDREPRIGRAEDDAALDELRGSRVARGTSEADDEELAENDIGANVRTNVVGTDEIMEELDLDDLKDMEGPDA